ncbi:hypothetical protein K435DRAFT_873045 [Dendrothele bispora CBS 962.96]|uniref:Uncharacterized protein n=1 Tax=Dendrothele bispora (strain CBS 962.96) TaxID=1314807 RepID=A0A4S8L034_DENBC|nr:hypothetical protein K435DRAFT_873045 [Dendrothele bispora CBS 962.96]
MTLLRISKKRSSELLLHLDAPLLETQQSYRTLLNGRGHQNTLAHSTCEKIDHDILKGLADHNTANGVNQQFPLRLYISLPSGSPKVSQDGQEELEDNSTDEESTMDTVKDSRTRAQGDKNKITIVQTTYREAIG